MEGDTASWQLPLTQRNTLLTMNYFVSMSLCFYFLFCDFFFNENLELRELRSLDKGHEGTLGFTVLGLQHSRQADCPGEVGQSKTNSLGFLLTLLLTNFVLLFLCCCCCLLVLIFLIFVCCFLRHTHRVREGRWEGERERELKLGREDLEGVGGGKIWSKYIV